MSSLLQRCGTDIISALLYFYIWTKFVLIFSTVSKIYGGHHCHAKITKGHNSIKNASGVTNIVLCGVHLPNFIKIFHHLRAIEGFDFWRTNKDSRTWLSLCYLQTWSMDSKKLQKPRLRLNCTDSKTVLNRDCILVREIPFSVTWLI